MEINSFKKLTGFVRTVFCILLLFCLMISPALAEDGVITDPGGSVPGLPGGIAILDSEGKDVPESGIYYFEVEKMNPGEVYTKRIQLMNLRTDGKKYHLYFYIEPIENHDKGIDLVKNCTQTLLLGNDQFYNGNIWGDGNIKVDKDHPVDLGLYEMGQSRIMTCNIAWNGHAGGEGSTLVVDGGHKIVDRNGVTIFDADGNLVVTLYDKDGNVVKNAYDENGALRADVYDENGRSIRAIVDDIAGLVKSEFRDYTDVKVDASGNTSLEGNISGEATFRWVFFAQLYEDSSDGGKKDDTKDGGGKIIDIVVPTGDNWPLSLLFWSLVVMSIVFFVLARKRQKEKNAKNGTE